MEAIAFVLGFVALGLLALRCGRDSREGIRSEEHELAAHGMTWTELATDRATPASGVASTGVTPPSSTPAFVERALGASSGALTAAPDAQRLEVRARDLATEYWSDAVWTTGVVPEAEFRRVLAELAPDLLDTFVPAGQPTGSAVVEPAGQARRVVAAT